MTAWTWNWAERLLARQTGIRERGGPKHDEGFYNRCVGVLFYCVCGVLIGSAVSGVVLEDL